MKAKASVSRYLPNARAGLELHHLDLLLMSIIISRYSSLDIKPYAVTRPYIEYPGAELRGRGVLGDRVASYPNPGSCLKMTRHGRPRSQIVAGIP